MDWLEIIHEEEPRRYHKGYRQIWLQFKEDYPELIERGTTYEPYGYMEITIHIPGLSPFVYNQVGTSGCNFRINGRWYSYDEIRQMKIRSEQKEIEDKRRREIEAKKSKEEYRSKMYKSFLSMLRYYQKAYGATQEDIAELSGYSRKTINEYMTGKAMPKVSTMRKICEALDLCIDD